MAARLLFLLLPAWVEVWNMTTSMPNWNMELVRLS
jgi:hypothetical protein